MQSFGSQTWDASLSIQALLAANINDEIGPVLKKAHEFLKISQVDLILTIIYLFNFKFSWSQTFLRLTSLIESVFTFSFGLIIELN